MSDPPEWNGDTQTRDEAQESQYGVSVTLPASVRRGLPSTRNPAAHLGMHLRVPPAPAVKATNAFRQGIRTARDMATQAEAPAELSPQVEASAETFFQIEAPAITAMQRLSKAAHIDHGPAQDVGPCSDTIGQLGEPQNFPSDWVQAVLDIEDSILLGFSDETIQRVGLGPHKGLHIRFKLEMGLYVEPAMKLQFSPGTVEDPFPSMTCEKEQRPALDIAEVTEPVRTLRVDISCEDVIISKPLLFQQEREYHPQALCDIADAVLGRLELPPQAKFPLWFHPKSDFPTIGGKP
ncbi:hypothetical protein FLAG1_06333 [Fusarium langsethiae]|uniref:Uncharacterized protein n=1 Tax=Fusarium langsethiae TaxID=179993 RepID=A0A0N0DE89_FUSLA|nr:hypothetical protein FLAG1_06333 [Fusarium langsethiae]GKU05925.1 unnamed protein product [Fusarium langsethiae]GKU20156.1 unnamed protein product [Fusarium langsethiae]